MGSRASITAAVAAAGRRRVDEVGLVRYCPLGLNKDRSSDPNIYQLTDCKSTLGFRVKVKGFYFHETTPLIPP